MVPARWEVPMKSAMGIRYEKCGSDCMTLRIGQSTRSKGGHLTASTPRVTPAAAAIGAATRTTESVVIESDHLPKRAK